MVALKLGTTDASKVYVGGVQVSAVYLGTTKVWPSGAYYREDFNRANGAIGADWNAAMFANPAARILNNSAQAGAVGSNTGRQACSWCVYVKNGGAFLTDNYIVRAQLKAPTDIATDNPVTLWAGGNATGTGDVRTYAVFSTGSSSYIIQAGSPINSGPGGSASAGGTQGNKANLGNVAATDLVEIKREGNLYTVLKNGAVFGSWNDGGTSAKGVGSRRWGFCLEANYPLFQKQFSSLGIDWIEAYDL